MNKDDELVWVFPECALRNFDNLPGVTPSVKDWTRFVRDVLETCRFMRRGDVEDEPTLQQVIPYVVIRLADVMLVYNRGKKGKETRLADEWSIGIGGHVNLADENEEDTNPFDTFMNAMEREIMEELNISKAEIDAGNFQFLGLLKSEATEVDRVHFGVVFTLQLPEIELGQTEEMDRYQWVTKEKLSEYSLESWSELVAQNLL